MSLVSRYKSVYMWCKSVADKHDHLETECDSVRRSYEDLLEELNCLVMRRSDLEAGVKTLLALMDKFSNYQLEAVRAMVNSALAAVFYDRKYQVKFVVADKRKVKTMEMLLVEEFPDGSLIESNIQDSIGGGVRTVIGLALRVYFMCYFSVSRVLFIDEGLVRVSSNYMERLLLLMKQMSSEMGFVFVVITHDDKVMSYADTMYTISGGKALRRELMS